MSSKPFSKRDEIIWKALENIVESYDKVTHSITLCLDDFFRELATKEIRGKRILDVGAGTGALSKKLMNKCSDCYIVSIEPIRSFSLYLKMDKRNEVIQAVAEYLPFRKKVFDYLMTSYMLRDAMDLEKALNNFEYVAWNIVILDFWKPDNTLTLFLELLYMYTIMIILVLIHDTRRFKYYLAIPYTVKKVPKLMILIEKLKKIGDLKFKKFFNGIFFIAIISSH